jgi:cytochrome c biogenesis protein CcdA
MLATIVETKDLLETVAASVIAGLGVTIVFSIAVYGATRFADLSRDERPVAAAAAISIALLAFAACVAGVVFGIVVMTSK